MRTPTTWLRRPSRVTADARATSGGFDGAYQVNRFDPVNDPCVSTETEFGSQSAYRPMERKTDLVRHGLGVRLSDQSIRTDEFDRAVALRPGAGGIEMRFLLGPVWPGG